VTDTRRSLAGSQARAAARARATAAAAAAAADAAARMILKTAVTSAGVEDGRRGSAKLGGSGRCLSRLQRSWQPVCAAAAWTDAAAEAGSLLPSRCSSAAERVRPGRVAQQSSRPGVGDARRAAVQVERAAGG